MDVTCVIDNTVQRSSSFWGEHGLAFLIETEARRVLFDTGQSGTVLLHNLARLDVTPDTIDALAISHAHYDHTGGLPELLDLVRPGIPLYANSALFEERFSIREGKPQNIGLELTREKLERKLTLHLSSDPLEIVPGLWTTGEITERPEPEGRSGHHRVREGSDFAPDPYQDDMALVLKRDREQALLCGCCHAGLLNTLNHARRVFELPIAAIAGGLHLKGTPVEEMQHIGDILLEMESLQHVYPNHCTGEGAFISLTLRLGPSIVHSCPAGTVLTF